jgi:hypothetical protein
VRKRDVDRKMFHRGHWEVIAARFREQLEPILEAQANYEEKTGTLSKYFHGQSTSLVNLALSLANRFALDNYEFSAEVFLDRCSPDPELYPLSELWEGVDRAEVA